ncbi:MAG TPA: hypothetical protein VJZ77_05940 [Blastocatellia bacterium]|nr:hypothetical protein [Blastocatellia bacterium]
MIESRQVFINLANAIADALECPETPASLADVLSEAVNPLAELLAPTSPNAVNIATLRGLATAAIAIDDDVTRPDLASLDKPIEACAGD